MLRKGAFFCESIIIKGAGIL